MATLKNTVFNDIGSITLPVGTTAQRPASPTDGMLRFNAIYLSKQRAYL